MSNYVDGGLGFSEERETPDDIELRQSRDELDKISSFKINFMLHLNNLFVEIPPFPFWSYMSKDGGQTGGGTHASGRGTKKNERKSTYSIQISQFSPLRLHPIVKKLKNSSRRLSTPRRFKSDLKMGNSIHGTKIFRILEGYDCVSEIRMGSIVFFCWPFWVETAGSIKHSLMVETKLMG